jgi:hypothetical protein
LNDDQAPSTHTFQSAAIGPDGVIYSAWLDRRELPVGKAEDYPGGGMKRGHVNVLDSVALYLARSTDGGQSFERNVRVADNVCACCRVAFGFSQGKVLAAWRAVDKNSIRDIAVAVSFDSGQTWTQPRIALKDGWKIDGCPHVGPAFATAGNKTWLTWVTRTDMRSGVFVASTTDGGQTFGPVQHVSTGVHAANHPQLAGLGRTLVAVFQGSTAHAADQPNAASHGHHGPPAPATIFLSHLQSDHSWSKPIQVSPSDRSATYPFAGIAPGGQIAVSWTEPGQDMAVGHLWINKSTSLKPGESR